MYHGLDNQFLYSAYKITATFVDKIGNVKSGIGTCFFIKNKYDKLCLITNRHVLDISYKKQDKSLLDYSLKEIVINGKRNRESDKLPEIDISFSLDPRVKFSSNQNNDIACISEIIPTSRNDNNIRIDYFIPYSLIAKDSDYNKRLNICDFLAFPGYPEWHDKLNNRPILRTGTISSDPRFDYSYKDLVYGHCVAYEAFSYSGSSGSPVFAVQKGIRPGPGLSFLGFRELLLIGINAGHLQTSNKMHSGISYFYKSPAILELVDE